MVLAHRMTQLEQRDNRGVMLLQRDGVQDGCCSN
jgi:hypothetical protein